MEDQLASVYADNPHEGDGLLDVWRPPRVDGASTRQPRIPRDWFSNDMSLSSPRTKYNRIMGSANSKRSRERFEGTDSSNTPRTLSDRGAVAVIQYRNATPDPEANDIWPEFRSASKLPAQYSLIDHGFMADVSRSKRRVPNIGEKRIGKDKPADVVGRPKWNLPVELVEIIAAYLDRDDIKALRMVSHELNHYISQVIFQTVVVPFNTEIYGMLAQGQKPDLKGKKRARAEKPGYSWRNTNGDEVYNGHGLDVFKGFGQHILKYGMSFEVNEESLSQPPRKSMTEKKTSFWGNYDWPFEAYRRFDAVAGLETAADETPRMKLAFSELTRVKELALSVDSGLGWLNGPDRSMRARILRRPPAVFGTSKDIPDRRAQAQQELWHHIELQHRIAGEDVKLATLYRMDGARPLSEADEVHLLAEEQPVMPYLDAQIIHEATPHDTTEVPLPISFDDPDVLDRFVLPPSSASTGILFSSIYLPTDAAQIMSPIIPANLTQNQKEWLLETEWAQRAFMSSYMLSIIDNPVTFTPIHTLSISRISDRYLTMLNRADFWDALPNLNNLTIMVIPGWRNVYKDEAGFVDTPRINPVNGLNFFCDLLVNQVANRSGIQNLTVGWIGGGEHAEGLNARNRLLMPAPLLPTVFRTLDRSMVSYDTVTESDPVKLQAALLRFPHVERLVVKNCWITPAALLEFVKVHDALALKHLVLDSVSLTAVLRPQGNGNQAAQPGAAANAQAPPAMPNALFQSAGAANVVNNNAGGHGGNQVQQLPNHNPPLNWLAQLLQMQMQTLQTVHLAQGNALTSQQQTALVVLVAQVQTQMQQVNQIRQQQAQLQQQGNHHTHVQTPNHQQLLTQQVQTQTQTQLQLQQQIATLGGSVAGTAAQIQAMQQQINAAAPFAVVQQQQQQLYQPPSSTNPQSLLQSPPREGSWTSIIDQITPGPNLSHFSSPHSLALPTRTTSLQTLTFNSCGYAKLPHSNFDQAGVDRGNRFSALTFNPLLMKRYNALAPAMMPSKWTHLGEIVQEVDKVEEVQLEVVWGLVGGWEDEEEARAVEFDGYARGGTGRFSGVVGRRDRVLGEKGG